VSIRQGTYKFEAPVTITSALGIATSFREGESLNDNAHTRWTLDKLGIKLDYLWVTAATEKPKKLRLMLLFLKLKKDVTQRYLEG
jgi:putative aldouronate transport system substrate-binding protein